MTCRPKRLWTKTDPEVCEANKEEWSSTKGEKEKRKTKKAVPLKANA